MIARRIMPNSTNAVFAAFRTKDTVMQAQEPLLRHGFYAHDFVTQYPRNSQIKDISDLEETHLLAFAKIGAILGGTLILPFAVLIARNTIAVIPFSTHYPFLQQILILVLGVLGGMVLGAASGSLVGIGTPLRWPYRYKNYLESGRIIMSVYAQTKRKQRLATKILTRAGGRDVSNLNEVSGWREVRRHNPNFQRSAESMRMRTVQ